jgi:hypothetical protein
MTLRDKFEQWFINDEEDEHYVGMVETVAIEHEKVADEFAIGFAEWAIAKNMGVNKFTLYTGELEIYKKEKGL